MSNRNFKSDIDERVAVMREKNTRIENRHREIELDKQRAYENGSSILPSQIKITLSRNEVNPIRTGNHDNGNYRGKGRQGYRQRGGGNGPMGYNLSKSLSRLSYDSNYNHNNSQPQQQHQFPINRQRGGGYGCFGGGGAGRGFYPRGGCGGSGGASNGNGNFDYVRRVEIERNPSRGGFGGRPPQRYSQNNFNKNNKNYHGQRNGQYQSITPAKSMPSLDPAYFNNQYSRPYGSGGGQGRGGGRGNYRQQQNIQPRPRRNSYRGQQTPFISPKMRPPAPPPFPPPSPSQPTSSNERWVRGFTVKDPNPICRVAAVSTKDEEVLAKSVPDNDSPFINPDDDDDDDGYIDDNPLDDLDQYTLKIDMDGGFIVHDAIICDPILSKPISSWIDDETNDAGNRNTESKEVGALSNDSDHRTENLKSFGKDGFDGFIFSNSSLTTSGVSTMSSLDCRINGGADDPPVRPIQRSYSVDQLDKVAKLHQSDSEQ